MLIGDIQDISPEAARMLNLSPRGLRGRNLCSFITDNRPRLMSDLLRAAEGLLIDRMSTIQPRDRRPVHVHLDVSAVRAGRANACTCAGSSHPNRAESP